MKNIDYLTSIAIGIFAGSIVLILSRILNFPITGILLSIMASSFVAAFLFNPKNKNEVNHRSLRGTGASFIFSLIFGLIFIIYYIPQINNALGNSDVSGSISLIILILIILIGGIMFGTIGGSIGSTVSDMIHVIDTQRKQSSK